VNRHTAALFCQLRIPLQLFGRQLVVWHKPMMLLVATLIPSSVSAAGELTAATGAIGRQLGWQDPMPVALAGVACWRAPATVSTSCSDWRKRVWAAIRFRQWRYRRRRPCGWRSTSCSQWASAGIQ
jgi:hypothetical protein